MDLADFASGFVNWVWTTPLFLLLLGCGLAFSVATKFTQWRILTHGYACIRGHYDQPGDTGHISHFQALCAALSATIGLGNIAGVAVAVSVGGPGAVFWMWVVGLLGMALKFMECSLAVMYRDVRDVPDPSAPALMEKDAEARTLEYKGEPPPEPGAVPTARGEVRGGPMWYMQKALVEPLFARGNPAWMIFKALAVLFAVSTILNSFGGGNMFQGWNVANTLKSYFHVPVYLSATVVSILVALVIIGGIKRIGSVASKLVPFMCVVYVAGAAYVIVTNLGDVPFHLAEIFRSAFTPAAEAGGFAGATIWIAFSQGLRRACFSNEAGEGSAAIAHAAARTEEPIREGIVAGIGPFIDTLIICTMSALVLLISGGWNRPAVGTVASFDADQVVVNCNAELTEKFAPLYFDRIQMGNERNLSIHLARPNAKDLVELSVPIAALEPDGVSAWTDVRRVVLDLTELKGDNREKIAQLAVGQPVHLTLDGADLTAFAFDTSIKGFGMYVVTLGVCLFAFSTMISWSYYGEKGAEYLLGPQAILPYKFVFVVFVFLGMVLDKFETVYDFSDATTGLMVLCNLPAVLVLSPQVLKAAKHYFHRLDTGKMPRRDK
ncbi:MAG: alanine:cation symporter family protein [Planctomycetes bacterium]|nr:alanine:cation symporter family protein [Planctomycetota bacterium]